MAFVESVVARILGIVKAGKAFMLIVFDTFDSFILNRKLSSHIVECASTKNCSMITIAKLASICQNVQYARKTCFRVVMHRMNYHVDMQSIGTVFGS